MTLVCSFQLSMIWAGLGPMSLSFTTKTAWDMSLRDSSPALFWGCPTGPKTP